MINENTMIKVFNRTNITVVASSDKRGYKFPYNNGEPTMQIIPFSDIEYINYRDSFFRNGTLTFEEDCEDEIYQKLGIDKSDVVKEGWLIEQIKDFNKDFAEFLTSVTDNMVMSRIQALVTLYKLNRYDLSIRLCKLVELRANELRRGKLTSELLIKPVTNTPVVENDEKISALEIQVAELKNMLLKQSAEPKSSGAKAEEEKQEPVKKQTPARKSTTKKSTENKE